MKYCLQAGHLAIEVSWILENNSPIQNLIKSFRGPGLQDVPHLHTQHSIKLIGKRSCSPQVSKILLTAPI